MKCPTLKALRHSIFFSYRQRGVYTTPNTQISSFTIHIIPFLTCISAVDALFKLEDFCGKNPPDFLKNECASGNNGITEKSEQQKESERGYKKGHRRYDVEDMVSEYV